MNKRVGLTTEGRITEYLLYNYFNTLLSATVRKINRSAKLGRCVQLRKNLSFASIENIRSENRSYPAGNRAAERF